MKRNEKSTSHDFNIQFKSVQFNTIQLNLVSFFINNISVCYSVSYGDLMW